MPALMIYLIKANIALILFYLAYRFGLRRLTFYMLNRFFLLFGIAFSALFPLLNLNAFFQHHQQLAGSVAYYVPDWNTLQQYVQLQNQFTVWTLIAYVFWAGVIIMFIRFCMQMLSLFRIHLRTEAGFLQEEKIRFMHDRINPFSFFKNIYINPELHTENELEKILIHEKIHAKGWHTADVLAGEINNIFYWFNPGAWMMKTAIQENLEFITDRTILSSGMDAKSYQYSLIKVSSIPFANPLTNHFNFSHLKTRIKMMNRKKSPGFHLLRYLLILPVLTIVVLVMTSSQRQSISLKTVVNITKQAKMNFQSRDSIPLPYSTNEPSSDYINFLRRNSSVESLEWYLVQGKGPVLIRIELKNGNVEDYDVNNPEGIKKGEAKYGKFPAPPPPPPPAPARVKSTSSNTSNVNTKNGSRHLLSVNLVPTSLVSPQEDTVKWDDKFYARIAYKSAQMKHYDWAENYAHKSLQLNPDNAKAKQVLHYVTQMQEYQKKMEEYEKTHEDMDAAPSHAVNFSYPVNNHGLLSETSSRIMTLFPAPPVDRVFGSNQTLSESVIGERSYRYNLKGATKNTRDIPLAHTIASGVNYGVKDTTAFPPKNALYIVNDKKVNRTYIQKLDPQSISSIDVLKDKKAIHEYGLEAKEGVIKIYTKAYEAAHPSIYREEMKAYEKQHSAKELGITFSARKVVIHTPDNGAVSSFAASPTTPVIFNLPDSVKPVILINGRVMNRKSALDKISPNEIDSMVVMKKDLPLLIKQYGAQAKNGVVKIYTKAE